VTEHPVGRLDWLQVLLPEISATLGLQKEKMELQSAVFHQTHEILRALKLLGVQILLTFGPQNLQKYIGNFHS
jgi:hypothetical protein